MTDDDETVDLEPAEAVEDPDEPIEVRPLECGNGSPWNGPSGCGPCAACEAETERNRIDFAADVANGKYDSKGYEPKDRKFRQDSLF